LRDATREFYKLLRQLELTELQIDSLFGVRNLVKIGAMT
jgi:hypothetical protein